MALDDPSAMQELRRECDIAITANEPATAPQVAILLHRLSLHYPDRKLNDKEAASVAQDWLSDLAGIPYDLIESAFTAWRRGPKSSFYPKPGEILAIIESEVRYRKHLAKRAREALELLNRSQSLDK